MRDLNADLFDLGMVMALELEPLRRNTMYLEWSYLFWFTTTILLLSCNLLISSQLSTSGFHLCRSRFDRKSSTLNVSNNCFNRSLPLSIFNATKLRVLDLSSNLISGEVSESIGQLRSLEVLNFSDNAFGRKVSREFF